MRRAVASIWVGLAAITFVAATGFAEDVVRTRLPDEHAYQKTLRTYLGSLTEKDFDHGITEKFTTPPDVDDPEVRYRHWLLSHLNQPLIGSKRGAPAVNAPSRLFTLAAIETPQGVHQPPLYAEPTAWLINWNYAGNPFHQSKAMKLRAFSVLVVLMTMLDDQIEHAPQLGGDRLDTLAPSLLTFSWPYSAIRDALPEDIQRAYEAGLRKFAARLASYDPKALQPNSVVVGPLALWTTGQALDDAAIRKQAEDLGRRIWTDEAYFHPAGYYIDRGGMDIGYAGSANIFTTWTALATGWPFAREALERTYRLKSYLALPEPDGRWIGPTHFNTRLGSDAPRDQWEWGTYRDNAAALVTNEAAWLAQTPTAEQLADAAATRSRACQGQVNENGLIADLSRFARNDELGAYPWKYRLWQNWSFPLSVNYGSVYAPANAFAQRQKLEADKSPWLKNPWDREPTFVRSLEKEFTFVKEPSYRAIIHSGRVGSREGNERPDVPAQFLDFTGFGGGQLSTFWTPSTGSVILGRRGGASRQKNFDTPETWRQWPIHAVSGVTSEGKIFTSSRILRPDVALEGRTVRVSGTIPAAMLEQDKVLAGTIGFARTFSLDTDSVRVETIVQGDEKDTVAELYETIPVFLRETALQANAVPTTIEFLVGDKVQTATGAWTDGVTGVRMTRFEGAVEIQFESPQRVKLSVEDWTDSYMSRASCRNILIDLLANGDQPKALKEARVAWRIAARAR
jgi:hypothetical protein